MQTVKDFIKENNLYVDLTIVNGTYICRLKGDEGTYKFSMTREKILEHMRRFCPKDFVEKIISDERFVMSHFRKLAVTWWHIMIIDGKLSKEIMIG